MSRIIKILEAIRNGTAYEAEPLSRVERILKTFIDGSEYTAEPLSRYEKLLLSIKGGYGTGNSVIPFPYLCVPNNNAVTFEAKSDGAVRVIGKTGEATFSEFTLAKNVNLVADKTYILSGGKSGVSLVLCYKNADGQLSYVSSIDGYTKFKWLESYQFVQIYLQVNPNTTVDMTIYPTMSENGRVLLFPDLRRPRTRLEEILFAIANGEALPTIYKSDLEEAYYLTAEKLKGGVKV